MIACLSARRRKLCTLVVLTSEGSLLTSLRARLSFHKAPTPCRSREVNGDANLFLPVLPLLPFLRVRHRWPDLGRHHQVGHLPTNDGALRRT